MTVVVAAPGYPQAPVTGGTVTVAALPDGVEVLHAGTRVEGDHVVSTGGRVLSVTASGDSLADARRLAYAGVAAVTLDGGHHRTDIALAAEQGRVTA